MRGLARGATLVACVIIGCTAADPQGAPLMGQGDAGGDDGGAQGGDNGGGDDASCTPSTPPQPMDPSKLPSCCSDGAAHCVPTADVPASVQKALAACSGGYCVPDPFIRDPGRMPPSCASVNGAAGVCLSLCVPQVEMYKNILPQATCAPDERCAPCVSPLDMKPTGACDIGKHSGGGSCGPGDSGGGGGGGGDAGNPPDPSCPHMGPPVIDPGTLPACDPNGGAHCLDASLVPMDQRAQLATCAAPNASSLCVPDTFIASGGKFIPPSCASLGGDEGRCLHEAIPEVAAQKAKLPVSTCAAYERCVPCYDPRSLQPTGACKLSCDPGPAKPVPGCPHQGPPYMDPASYPACDQNEQGAHCVDAASVSPQLQGQLATCSTGFCVPDPFIADAGRYVPPTCDSLEGGEGRCLNDAIPKIAAQQNLPVSTCQSFEKCAPCYNPIDGSDTGACRLSCDQGPTRPKVVFADCCSLGGQTYGKCVPPDAVPQNEQQYLGQDTCGGQDLCAPTENILPSFHPPACEAFAIVYGGYYQGVCLSDCLQFTGVQGLVIKQGDCDAVHQCVPCQTPAGQPTGAPGCN